MVNDGGNDFGAELFAGENLEDLGFGDMRVVEDNRKNLGAAFGEQRARHSVRAAAGESYFLAKWKLRKPSDELIFGDPL